MENKITQVFIDKLVQKSQGYNDRMTSAVIRFLKSFMPDNQIMKTLDLSQGMYDTIKDIHINHIYIYLDYKTFTLNAVDCLTHNIIFSF